MSLLALRAAERPLLGRKRTAVHFVGAPLQQAGEPARAGGKRPEEEERQGIARLAPEFERSDEAQVYRIEKGKEKHCAYRSGDERRPKHPHRVFHEASLRMRQLPRGSSIAMRQRPGGIGGSAAAYAPVSVGARRKRKS